MNKYELAKKITQLEGLTNEEKALLVELLRSQKKYGLVWEDKPEEIETRLVDELPILTEVTERAIVSDSPDAPNHILIEGDNLEALTALAYTHEGKIDVIYIDPPYNTGNKDFVYNDSFVDREDGYRHSKWLSFMNKRLQIAKSLLSSGGVIFISIDDNEQAPLRLLCDEIFGCNNYEATITYVRKTSGKQDSANFAKSTEYILVYSKNSEWIASALPANEKVTNRYNKVDTQGRKYRETDLRKTGNADRRIDRPLMYYPFYYNPITKDLIVRQDIDEQLQKDYIEIFPIKPDNTEGRWRWAKNTAEDNLQNLEAKEMPRYKGKYTIYEKDYIDKNENERTVKEHTSWDRKDFNSDNAMMDFKELGFGNQDFPFPKSTDLIQHIIFLSNYLDGVYLDFFAGSGTTLQALMRQNAEDGGHRKCILVTNNENNICEEVTYERNKRVIQGYTTPKGEEVEGLHDNNLRYYRTTLLSRDKSVKNMRQLVRLATDMLCIKNDVYTEAEFCGKKINPNIARYFDNGQGNRMLVIYEERAIQLLVQLMAQTEDDGIKTMVYVFSPGADPYTDDFEDIAERVKLCALPSAIYEAYKRVLPKRKPKFLDEALQEMKAQAEAEANMQQTLDFGENDNMNEEGGEA